MTDQQHPITPPLELVKQWSATIYRQTEDDDQRDLYIATQAARWGADRELEECCHLLRLQGFDVVDDLRAARRPKPPSLKEQALSALKRQAIRSVPSLIATEDCDLIRRALEGLPDD